MNKKEIITPILVIGLGLTFAIISFAVFLSKGKSKKWVSRKMKIGAMLLTLSSAACNNLITTCYDMPAPPNTINIYPNVENGIELMLDTGNVIQGIIYERQGENFSFTIENANNQMVQSDLLVPIDGVFDNYNEEFKIEVDTNIVTGTYALKLFDVGIAAQADAVPKQEINLLIKSN